MSFYTSSIRSEQIDPRLDQNNTRAEFRFNEDTVYLSNMRLLNVGLTSSVGKKINVGAGILQVIKNIQLLDGAGQVLDQLRDVDRYGAFLNYKNPNASNVCLDRVLYKHSLGYDIAGEEQGVDSRRINFPGGVASGQPDYGAGETGWIDLKKLLPMLNSVLYLPTQVFKNLTLRIEFNNAVGSNQNTTAPLLVADSMADGENAMKMVKAFKGVDYVSVENDQVHITGMSPTAGEPNPKQVVRKLLKGYDNKVLNRLVLVKTPVSTSTGVSTELGHLGSQLYLREKENLRVNGRTLLVGDGLDSPNKALAKVSDVYGTCNSYGNLLSANDFTGGGFIIGGDSDEKARSYIGEQDYRAFLVGQYVDDMELTFERTGDRDSAETDENNAKNKINHALTLHAFGEVKKTLQVQPDGSYLISYPRQ